MSVSQGSFRERWSPMECWFAILIEVSDGLAVVVTSDPSRMLDVVSCAADDGQRCSIVPFDVAQVVDPDGFYSDLFDVAWVD